MVFVLDQECVKHLNMMLLNMAVAVMAWQIMPHFISHPHLFLENDYYVELLEYCPAKLAGPGVKWPRRKIKHLVFTNSERRKLVKITTYVFSQVRVVIFLNSV